MPISFMDFVNQAKLSTSSLFVGEDGDKLKSESSFSYFSFAKRADENNRTVAAFLDSLRNDPNYASFYSPDFDRTLRLEVAEGKPLTSDAVEHMHKMLERQKAEDDIAMTKAFIAILQKNGIVSGELAEKLEKYAIENGDFVKGGNIDTVKAFLSRYFKSQGLFEVAKPLYSERGMFVSEDKRAAFESYLEKADTLQEAIDKAFEDSTLEDLKNVEALLQPTIREAHEKIKPFLEALDDADARKLVSEIKNSKVLSVVETIADAIKHGLLDKTKAYKFFESMLGNKSFMSGITMQAKEALYRLLFQDEDIIKRVLDSHPEKEKLSGLESYGPFLGLLAQPRVLYSIDYKKPINPDELRTAIYKQITAFLEGKDEIIAEYASFLEGLDKSRPPIDFTLFYTSKKLLKYIEADAKGLPFGKVSFDPTAAESSQFVHNLADFIKQSQEYAKRRFITHSDAMSEVLELVMAQTKYIYDDAGFTFISAHFSRFLDELLNCETAPEFAKMPDIDELKYKSILFSDAVRACLDAVRKSYSSQSHYSLGLMERMRARPNAEYKITDQKSMSRYMLEYSLMQGVQLRSPNVSYRNTDGTYTESEVKEIAKAYVGTFSYNETYKTPPRKVTRLLEFEIWEHERAGTFPFGYGLDFSKANPMVFSGEVEGAIKKYRESLHPNESLNPDLVNPLIEAAIKKKIDVLVNDGFQYILRLDVDKACKKALMQTVLTTGIVDHTCIDFWASLIKPEITEALSLSAKYPQSCYGLAETALHTITAYIASKSILDGPLDKISDQTEFYRGMFFMIKEFLAFKEEDMHKLDLAFESEEFLKLEKMVTSLYFESEERVKAMMSSIISRVESSEENKGKKTTLEMIESEKTEEEKLLLQNLKNTSFFCFAFLQNTNFMKNEIDRVVKAQDSDAGYSQMPEFAVLESLDDIVPDHALVLERFLPSSMLAFVLDPLRKDLCDRKISLPIREAKILSSAFETLKSGLPAGVEEVKITSIIALTRDSILQASKAKKAPLNLGDIMKAITGSDITQDMSKRRVQSKLGRWLERSYKAIEKLGHDVDIDSAKELLKRGITPTAYLQAMQSGKLQIEDIGSLPPLAEARPWKKLELDVDADPRFFRHLHLKTGILPADISPSEDLYNRGFAAVAASDLRDRMDNSKALMKDLVKTISGLSSSTKQRERIFQALEHSTYKTLERYFSLMAGKHKVRSYSIAIASDKATGNVHIEVNFKGTGGKGVFKYTIATDGSYTYDKFDINLR